MLASTEAIEADPELGPRRKRMAAALAEHAGEARLARRLVSLETDVPLPVDLADLRPRSPDREACAALFGRLGLAKMLETLGLEAATPELATLESRPADYRVVRDRAALEELASGLGQAGRFALDTETDDRNPLRAKLVGLSVVTEPGSGAYVPVGHVEGENASLTDVRLLLGPVLADAKVAKVGQNAKFDLEVLARHDLPVAGLAFDTMVASYLLDSSRRSHALDQLAADCLGYRPISYSEVARRGDEEVTLDLVDVERVADYCCEDGDVALQLARLFEPRLAEAGLTELFDAIEMPLVPVLAAMELAGVRVDPAVLAELSVQLSARLEALTHEIHDLAGRELNIASPKQLGEVLFDELGLRPRGRTAKTGARSTSVEILEELAAEHPLPGLVLEHRELSKLKGTYLDVLPRLIDPATGRVHPSYNQSVAATGRLSCSDPNVQNIPVRTELGRRIRRAFVAEEGFLLVGADYSQVELRVMAHVSGDETLIDSFARGVDIHSATAQAMFGVPAGQVTPQLRARAKEINFGVLYGMTAHGLAQRLSVGRGEAQAIIDRYFSSHAGVRDTVQRIIAECREDREHRVRTIFGRYRALPDIVSRNQGQRGFAERAAVNAVIQGTAADLIKLAMIRLHERLQREEPESRLILQVHDELLVEAPAARAEAVREAVQRTMEGVHPLRVPLVAHGAIGRSWYDLK
jgi:DNA polymerase-1